MWGDRRDGGWEPITAAPTHRAREGLGVPVRCGRPVLIVVGASARRCAPDAVMPDGKQGPRSTVAGQPQARGKWYSACETSSTSHIAGYRTLSTKLTSQ